MDDALKGLDVWRRSKKLAVDIYKMMESCRDYGFKDQITRASVSVPSNIAEGCGRKTDADFARFVQISMGSATEVEYQLLLAHDLKYIKDEILELIKNDDEVWESIDSNVIDSKELEFLFVLLLRIKKTTKTHCKTNRLNLDEIEFENYYDRRKNSAIINIQLTLK